MSEDKQEGGSGASTSKKKTVRIQLKKNRAVSNLGGPGEIVSVEESLAGAYIAAGYAVPAPKEKK